MARMAVTTVARMAAMDQTLTMEEHMAAAVGVVVEVQHLAALAAAVVGQAAVAVVVGVLDPVLDADMILGPSSPLCLCLCQLQLQRLQTKVTEDVVEPDARKMYFLCRSRIQRLGVNI